MNKVKLVEIYNKANAIMKSNLSWIDKYQLIFSENICMKTLDVFNWYDPDTDYRDDVNAFMYAFKNYMEKEGLLEKQTEYNNY